MDDVNVPIVGDCVVIDGVNASIDCSVVVFDVLTSFGGWMMYLKQ